MNDMLHVLRAEAGKAAAEGRNMTVAPEAVLLALSASTLAEADNAAWWQIVNDLCQLGCLDCSNNACDRARDALGAGHPGAALLAELEAARAVVAAARKTRAALPGAADMHGRLVALSSALAAYDEAVKASE